MQSASESLAIISLASSKNTGTLLSPNDRSLGDNFKKEVVLTMYRIIGNKEKGWDGGSLWIPNIKFPDDICFYDMEEY